jgi:hypothetical protein
MTGVRICPNHFGQPAILNRPRLHFKENTFSANLGRLPPAAGSLPPSLPTVWVTNIAGRTCKARAAARERALRFPVQGVAAADCASGFRPAARDGARAGNAQRHEHCHEYGQENPTQVRSASTLPLMRQIRGQTGNEGAGRRPIFCPQFTWGFLGMRRAR